MDVRKVMTYDKSNIFALYYQEQYARYEKKLFNKATVSLATPCSAGGLYKSAFMNNNQFLMFVRNILHRP